jgi:alpha-tubulin suppressor-like RCC1 family protein
VLEPTRVGSDEGWSAIAAGGLHTCGLRSGALYCWGFNTSGELGIGDVLSRASPVQTGCLDGTCPDDWVAIGPGGFHTCAIREEGALWCWGGNLFGNLGIGRTGGDLPTPQAVRPDERWRAVAGGEAHGCAIRDDGALFCWGQNVSGQLGVGDRLDHDEPTRVRAPGTDDWVGLGLGRAHSCAVRSDRTLWCWGDNAEGQVGIGTVTQDAITTPRRVCLPGP